MARRGDKFIEEITSVVLDAITPAIIAARDSGLMSWHFTRTNKLHAITQAILKWAVDNGNWRPMSVMEAIGLVDAEVINFLNDLGYACERAIDNGILIKWE